MKYIHMYSLSESWKTET